MQTMGTLDQLTKFGDISALTGGGGEFGNKKRKSKSKAKGGHKKKKKVRMWSCSMKNVVPAGAFFIQFVIGL